MTSSILLDNFLTFDSSSKSLAQVLNNKTTTGGSNKRSSQETRHSSDSQNINQGDLMHKTMESET